MLRQMSLDKCKKLDAAMDIIYSISYNQELFPKVLMSNDMICIYPLILDNIEDILKSYSTSPFVKILRDEFIIEIKIHF
jgi:hypothetical protein